MDTQEKQTSTKTLAEQYSDLVVQLNLIKSILKGIQETYGVSNDSLQSAFDYQRKFNQLNNSLQTIWGQLSTNSNRVQQVGVEFNDLEVRIIELHDNIKALYTNVKDESSFSAKLYDKITIDKNEFTEALKHHKSKSNTTLYILGAASLLSLILILFVFALFPAIFSSTEEKNSGKVQAAQDIGNTIPEKTNSVSGQWQDSAAWWSKIILNFSGKFALLFALAWMLKFIGDLHSRHVAQSIIYQDRLAALSTIDVITIGANTQTREKILLKMSETYLNLENNAFISREKEKAPSEEVFSKKDLVGLLKEVAGLVKKNQ